MTGPILNLFGLPTGSIGTRYRLCMYSFLERPVSSLDVRWLCDAIVWLLSARCSIRHHGGVPATSEAEATARQKKASAFSPPAIVGHGAPAGSLG